MKFIELRSPKPKAYPSDWTPYNYQLSGVEISCKCPSPKMPGIELFRDRHTERTFRKPSKKQLYQLLEITSRTICLRSSGQRVVWEHRPTPSAGGLHPIDVLIAYPNSPEQGIYLYNPQTHSLSQIRVSSKANFLILLDAIHGILPPESAIAIIYAAQFEKSMAVYNNGESLVWRDVGALIGVTCLAATGLGLNCCPLGATFDPQLSIVLGTDSIRGVGACLVGA